MAAFTASLALLTPWYESAASPYASSVRARVTVPGRRPGAFPWCQLAAQSNHLGVSARPPTPHLTLPRARTQGVVEPHVPGRSLVSCRRHRRAVFGARRREVCTAASGRPHGGPSPSRSWPQGGRHSDTAGAGAAAGGSSATVGAAMGVSREPLTTAVYALVALGARLASWVDWRHFGRHQQYGNGTPRTLARGWVHVAALLALEVCLWACSASVGPFQPLPPRAASLARWTATAFYGSVVFHLVPWHTVPAYNVALCVDFMAIMCVRTVSCLLALATPPCHPHIRYVATSLTASLSLRCAGRGSQARWLCGWVSPAPQGCSASPCRCRSWGCASGASL